MGGCYKLPVEDATRRKDLCLRRTSVISRRKNNDGEHADGWHADQKASVRPQERKPIFGEDWYLRTIFHNSFVAILEEKGVSFVKLYRFMSSKELLKYLDGDRIEPIYEWEGFTGEKKETMFVSFMDDKMFYMMQQEGYSSYGETVFGQSLCCIVEGDILAAFTTTKAFLRESRLRKATAHYFYGEMDEYHADFYDDRLLKLDWYVEADCRSDYPVDMGKCRKNDKKRRNVIKRKRQRLSKR